VVVNICPAALTTASPDRVWEILTAPERFGEWLDARFVSAEPPGPVKAGQRITLSAPSLGRSWPVSIDVVGVDPDSRWVELVVRLPFAIVNHERLMLTALAVLRTSSATAISPAQPSAKDTVPFSWLLNSRSSAERTPSSGTTPS
jgi:hypothetical protein